MSAMNGNNMCTTNELIGFAASILRSLAEEHPKEMKIFVYGSLTFLCGMKFVYELRH